MAPRPELPRPESHSRPGGRRPPGARAPWGTISRRRIVETATEAVRRWGYQQVTIRSLAAELGVSPMSLYRHVRDKDDLLDEVVDRLLAESWRPEVEQSDWRGWVADAADRLRLFLVGEPAAMHVYLRRPVVSTTAMVRMDAMLEVLRAASFDSGSARRAYAAIHTYTVGFAALEASRASWSPPTGAADGARGDLAAYSTPSQFNEGLSYLLAGIGAPVAEPPGATGARGRRS